MQTAIAAVFVLGTLMSVGGVSVEFKARYYSNTTLHCDDSLLGFPQYTVYKIWWITPNGTIIQWSHDPGNSSRYVVSPFPIYNLTISHVDDDVFGWYRCVILWDDYIFLVHSINIGLNVDGALYDDLFDEYKSRGLIGLLAGGSTSTLVGLLCLLYWCRYSEINRVNEDSNKSDDENEKLHDSKDLSTDLTEEEQSVSEKEAIYELDKAVKCYDVEETPTVIGNGDIAVISSGQLSGSNATTASIEPVQEATDMHVTDTKDSYKYQDDVFDCYDHIPTPPPPPPPPLDELPGKRTDELNAGDDVIYFNRAFEPDTFADDIAIAQDIAKLQVSDTELAKEFGNWSFSDTPMGTSVRNSQSNENNISMNVGNLHGNDTTLARDFGNLKSYNTSTTKGTAKHQTKDTAPASDFNHLKTHDTSTKRDVQGENAEPDSDLCIGDIKSNFDTMKSISFQEELIARLMGNVKEKVKEYEVTAKSESEDDDDRVHF